MSTNRDEYKANGKSQLDTTQSFSTSLNETFAIETNPKLQGLIESVEQKKQAVSTQSQELEALEAKLRETEARLKQKAKLAETNSAAETTSPAKRRPVPPTSERYEHTQVPVGSSNPFAAQAYSAAGSAPPPMYARWEGLMPQASDQRSR